MCIRDRDESLEIGNIDFILPLVNEHVVCYTSVNNASTAGALASLCVTDAWNAYAQVRDYAGPAFEYPINTSERGKAPEYKVAPYVGVSMARPGNGETALLSDTDNKRFVGWKYGYVADAMQELCIRDRN